MVAAETQRSLMMTSSIHLSALSPSRRQLVELMQQINFGRIEGLLIHGGEPALDESPIKVFLEVKFGGENGPRSEASAGDFALKAQVVDLFSHLDQLQQARIEVLTIKHGLPFGMNVEARR
jgi:hypothetical protein